MWEGRAGRGGGGGVLYYKNIILYAAEIKIINILN